MAVKLIRGLSLYGSIDQVWQTAVPGFYIIGNCISYYIKKPPAGCALRRIMKMSQATATGARMCFAHSLFFLWSFKLLVE